MHTVFDSTRFLQYVLFIQYPMYPSLLPQSLPGGPKTPGWPWHGPDQWFLEASHLPEGN